MDNTDVMWPFRARRDKSRMKRWLRIAPFPQCVIIIQHLLEVTCAVCYRKIRCHLVEKASDHLGVEQNHDGVQVV